MIHTFPTLPSSPLRPKRDLNSQKSISPATATNPTLIFKIPIPHHYQYSILSSGSKNGKLSTRLWNSSNPTAVATTRKELDSAADVVRNFYEGINSRNLESVEDLIAQNCVYEDLVFPRPFVGRKAILEFFNQFIDSISTDLQFAIDDISEEDTCAVGVTWHLEWKGKPFPFSKGCSFYRLDVFSGQRQIIYARDSVEPAIKPGETALVVIRGVTWLLQKFPFLVDRL